MSDKQERYSHVRILESTDARVVVHWRYALSESENYKGAYPDPFTGWFDWGDEYWTVYPDGVAARKQVPWSSHLDGVRPGDAVGATDHEFQESIVLNGPGKRSGPGRSPRRRALRAGRVKEAKRFDKRHLSA